MDIFEVKQSTPIAHGIQALQTKTCKYCGGVKELLSQGKTFKMYKFCTCQDSVKALKVHDEKVNKLRYGKMSYARQQYRESIAGISTSEKDRFGNTITPGVWKHNVECRIMDMIGHDKELLEKSKRFAEESGLTAFSPIEYYDSLSEICIIIAFKN